MVSQTGKYALRILGYLADRPERWVQGKIIATETGIPANYLSKILNQLRKRGLVQSRKGWGGGFLLRSDALPAPISEVVELFEGRKEGKDCIFELRKCDSANPCPLHKRWEPIRGDYDGMLQSITIGDLRSQTG
jgi:Rrf2 family iron-sulfur cluster assembly transcriptional regulator